MRRNFLNENVHVFVLVCIYVVLPLAKMAKFIWIAYMYKLQKDCHTFNNV